MKKLIIVIMVLLCSTNASAFGLAISLGEGFGFYKGDVYRTPFNLELVPYMQFSIVKIDLGLITELDREINFGIRPGVRIYVPFVYFRAAMPMRFTHGFDYGFLLGIGGNIFTISIVSFFVELDTYFTKEGGWDRVPLEFRVGVDLSF